MQIRAVQTRTSLKQLIARSYDLDENLDSTHRLLRLKVNLLKIGVVMLFSYFA
jgi:hypothetical protein